MAEDDRATLRLLGQGLSNRAIAKRLHLPRRYVAHGVERLPHKFYLDNG